MHLGILVVQIKIMLFVARVRRRDDRPPSRKNRKYLFLANRERDKEFLSLQVKIWTGSRHLVFWLPGTLTGLRDGYGD